MSRADEDRDAWFETLRRPVSEKSWSVAFGLSVCLGVFGVDRLYLSSFGLAVLKFISFGGGGLWWLADIVLLLVGKMKDGHGGIVRRPF